MRHYVQKSTIGQYTIYSIARRGEKEFWKNGKIVGFSKNGKVTFVKMVKCTFFLK